MGKENEFWEGIYKIAEEHSISKEQIHKGCQLEEDNGKATLKIDGQLENHYTAIKQVFDSVFGG